MRKWILGIWLLVIIGVAIWMVRDKEQVLREGELMLVELNVRDPLSLMQGSFMTLNFTAFDTLNTEGWAQRGDVAVMLDAERIVQSVRLLDGAQAALQSGELRLPYRLVHGDVVWGASSYLFPQGEEARFERARYAAFRVADDGNVLVGLHDSSGVLIEVP